MLNFKIFFFLPLSFILGKFFNDIFSITNIIEKNNEILNYHIPFKYGIPIYYFPFIIIFTIIGYMYINRKILLLLDSTQVNSKNKLYKIKNFICSAIESKELLNIISLELILFSFLLGTTYSSFINNLILLFFEKYNNFKLLHYILFCLFFYSITFPLIEIFFYKPKNTVFELSNEIYDSRKNKLALLKSFLEYSNTVSITGEWGIGKTSFIKYYLMENQEQIEYIYIDVSFFSDISKIISTITYKLNDILDKYNLPSSNFLSIKSALKEGNLFFKVLYLLYTNSSIENDKENLKLKISKIKDKQIIIILDNIERVHKTDSKKLISLFSVIEEFFKNTGIKTILIFESNHLTEVLDIDKNYLEKYIEEEIILKKEELEQVLLPFNFPLFSREIIYLYKEKLKKFENFITDYKKKNTFTTTISDLDIKECKDLCFKFIELSMNALKNPRYLDRLYKSIERNSKFDYSINSIVEYTLFKDFNNIDIFLCIKNPYWITNLKDDLILNFFYEFFFNLDSYHPREIILKKITLQLLEENKSIPISSFLDQSISDKIDTIETWNNHDFVKFLDYLDSRLSPEESLKKLLKIKSALPENIFLFKDYSLVYSLFNKSFTEELFSENFFKNKIKIDISAFKKASFALSSYESSRINLIMAYLANTYWFKILLQYDLDIEKINNEYYIEKFYSILENLNINPTGIIKEDFELFIKKLKEIQDNFKYLSKDQYNYYDFYFNRMINTLNSIFYIEFIISSNKKSTDIKITLSDIINLEFEKYSNSLTYTRLNYLTIGKISIKDIEEVQKIKADLRIISSSLILDQQNKIKNELIFAKIAILFFEISNFETSLNQKIDLKLKMLILLEDSLRKKSNL